MSIELDPSPRAALAQALAAEGFAAGDEAPWARIVEAREETFEEAGRTVGWVLGGGVLAICGGTGPLLAALHLTPADDAVTGEVTPVAPGLPLIPLAEARPVTGVGYALYRVSQACVALAGPRGAGWVLCVATPEPRLVAACLGWIRDRMTRNSDNPAS